MYLSASDYLEPDCPNKKQGKPHISTYVSQIFECLRENLYGRALEYLEQTVNKTRGTT